LLAERFRVAVHEEERSVPGFALVIDKGGLRMKESSATASSDSGGSASPSVGKDGVVIIPPGLKGMWRNIAGGRVVIQGRQERIADLAEFLTDQLDQPVADETGVGTRYDFRIEFAQADLQAGDSGPSIFTAVKKLGLRLEATKVPAKMIVVDHAEKTPTGN